MSITTDDLIVAAQLIAPYINLNTNLTKLYISLEAIYDSQPNAFTHFTFILSKCVRELREERANKNYTPEESDGLINILAPLFRTYPGPEMMQLKLKLVPFLGEDRASRFFQVSRESRQNWEARQAKKTEDSSYREMFEYMIER